MHNNNKFHNKQHQHHAFIKQKQNHKTTQTLANFGHASQNLKTCKNMVNKNTYHLKSPKLEEICKNKQEQDGLEG